MHALARRERRSLGPAAVPPGPPPQSARGTAEPRRLGTRRGVLGTATLAKWVEKSIRVPKDR